MPAIAKVILMVSLASGGCRGDPPPMATTAPPPTEVEREAPTTSPAPAPVPAPPPQPAAAAIDLATATAQLASPAPDLRDAAAAAVRTALGAGARLPGDHGEDYWRARLAQLHQGIGAAAFARATGATSEGGASSGQSSTTIWRLDDLWTVEAYFDLPDRLRATGSLAPNPRRLWVEPPRGFTGRWRTYFITGVLAHDIDYRDGGYTRFAAHHATGQLAYEQRYVRGQIDGPELGFHPNGERAYAGAHADGKQVGRWQFWYRGGLPESDQTYVDGALHGRVTRWRADGTRASFTDYDHGRETGQAAWDERGQLLYARGTTAAP